MHDLGRILLSSSTMSLSFFPYFWISQNQFIKKSTGIAAMYAYPHFNLLPPAQWTQAKKKKGWEFDPQDPWPTFSWIGNKFLVKNRDGIEDEDR